MKFKHLLRGAGGSSAKREMLRAGEGAELALHDHFKLIRKLGKGSFATV